jgi:hypothetical protein
METQMLGGKTQRNRMIFNSNFQKATEKGILGTKKSDVRKRITQQESWGLKQFQNLA